MNGPGRNIGNIGRRRINPLARSRFSLMPSTFQRIVITSDIHGRVLRTLGCG
jgi:hypothetical protein